MTNLNSFSQDAKFNLYPNPNNGSFVLSITSSDITKFKVEVLSVQRQVVYSKAEFNYDSNIDKKIDLGNSAKGVYYVRVNSNSSTSTHKLVVQ